MSANQSGRAPGGAAEYIFNKAMGEALSKVKAYSDYKVLSK